MRIVYKYILAILIFALSTIIFNGTWQSHLLVPIVVLGTTHIVQLGAVVTYAWILGLFTGFIISWLNKFFQSTKTTQLNWQAQDNKLISEIASDREKQLEAKITTLEAALKQALKK